MLQMKPPDPGFRRDDGKDIACRDGCAGQMPRVFVRHPAPLSLRYSEGTPLARGEFCFYPCCGPGSPLARGVAGETRRGVAIARSHRPRRKGGFLSPVFM